MAFELAGASSNYLDLLDNLETFANANGWSTLNASEEAVSATVAAGGSGYVVGNTLILDLGATGQIFPGQINAQFDVSAESGGVVTAVTLNAAGGYHQRPTGPPIPTSLGVVTGCTLNVVFQNTPTTLSGKRLILKGTGSGGGDEIFIGYVAEDFGGGVFGWTIAGFTGFQAGVDFFSQPGKSPYLGFVPLNNGSMTHWFFVNQSRIIGLYRIATTYTNSYSGFVRRFGTINDFPYPLAIIGCSSQVIVFSNTVAGMGGMNNPMYHLNVADTFGPGQIRTPGGQWISLANSGGSLTFVTPRGDAGITPPGKLNTIGGPGSRTWDDFFPGDGSSPNFTFRQTPDPAAATGFRFPLIPTMVYEQVPQFEIHGELDGVYYSGALTELVGQATTEDTYNINGTDYILFQNCNRTDHWTFFLIKVE